MVDKLVKEEIKMDNRDVLALFGLIDKYCESENCDFCIIKDICECTYDEIGIPCHWVKTIEKRIKRIEQEKYKKNKSKGE